MTKKALYHALDYVDSTRQKRIEMSNLVLNDPNLVEPLLEIAFEVDDPISIRACWILEYVVKKDLSYIFTYLDMFTQNLGKVHLESSIRPMAKTCEILTRAFFSKKKSELHHLLKEVHLERITAVCFDWLIDDHKVAPKAYSMTSLLLLGRKFDWIHSELKMVLEQNYATGSAAYKARARLTLAKLK